MFPLSPPRRTLMLLAAAAIAGCEAGPVTPDMEPLFASHKCDPWPSCRDGGGGGGGDDSSQLVADVLAGDYQLGTGGLLVSTCPATNTKQWHVNFEHSLCLIVEPEGSSAEFGEYDLTDDVKLLVTKEAGKNGRITHVRLSAQDVIGEEGIHHSTDPVPVTPVVPDRAGFTIHVHAQAVPVYRHSGHTGGARVDVIGVISIGDIVYR